MYNIEEVCMAAYSVQEDRRHVRPVASAKGSYPSQAEPWTGNPYTSWEAMEQRMYELGLLAEGTRHTPSDLPYFVRRIAPLRAF